MNLKHLATWQNQAGSKTKKAADDTSPCPSETHFQCCYVALAPAWVRERGTSTFSLSTASSLLKEREKKTLKGRNRKPEGQHRPPKTIQEAGEKANEEGTKE